MKVLSLAATIFSCTFIQHLCEGEPIERCFRVAKAALGLRQFSLIDPADDSMKAKLAEELPSWSAGGIVELFLRPNSTSIPESSKLEEVLVSLKELHQTSTAIQQKTEIIHQQQSHLQLTTLQLQNTTEDIGRGELNVPKLFLIVPKLRSKRFKLSVRNTILIIFLCPIDGKIARYGGKDGLKVKLPNSWLNAFLRFKSDHPILMSLSALMLSLCIKLFTGLSLGDVIPSSCLNQLETGLSALEFVQKYCLQNFNSGCLFDSMDVNMTPSTGMDWNLEDTERFMEQNPSLHYFTGQKYRQLEQFLNTIGFDSAKLEMHKVKDSNGRMQWISNRHQCWPTEQL